MDLHDMGVGASCVHMAGRGGYKGNCKISLYHTVLEAPKPSGNNDKPSGDRGQYDNQTENRVKLHLFERTSQALWTRTLMISLFTSVVSTRKRFPAYDIANVPAVFI